MCVWELYISATFLLSTGEWLRRFFLFSLRPKLVERHSSERILEPWVSETVLSPSASPLGRTCQGLCCVALNPPPFPPRATAGRVIGAASQQQRALFYPLPSYHYLLSYTPPYYPLLPAILSTASNLIHLIKLADLAGRPLCLPIIAIAPVCSAFPQLFNATRFYRGENGK